VDTPNPAATSANDSHLRKYTSTINACRPQSRRRHGELIAWRWARMSPDTKVRVWRDNGSASLVEQHAKPSVLGN
jgi:hypothetical protein